VIKLVFERRPTDAERGVGTDWRGDCEGNGQSRQPADGWPAGGRAPVKDVVDISTRR